MGLRSWQRDALARYTASNPTEFLVNATPGSGKTRFALAVAEHLRQRRLIDRVVVIAPTDHLRTQWAAAAHQAGFNLDPALGNNDGRVPDGMDGYVATYAQLAARPIAHERRVGNRRTLLIADEVHHAGDSLAWGEAFEEVGQAARRRLLLTGTPFRTDGAAIPFVPYSEPDSSGARECLPDADYSYTAALADNVVRPVTFAAYTGTARWSTDAGEAAAHLADPDMGAEDLRRAWRTVLDPKGRWIRHVLAAAHDRLLHLRAAGMPDAAGMLVAGDQESARAYADVLAEVTGDRAVVAVSDDPSSGRRIAEFTDGTDPWIVSVRQISEGTDIPRLAVGVIAVPGLSSRLLFTQLVGRFIRARRVGEVATVYLPAVGPLLALAAEIETERNTVTGPPPAQDEDEDAHDLPDPQPRELTGVTQWEALEADAEFGHVLSGGRAYLPAPDIDPYEHDDPEASDFLGLPGLLDAEQTAVLLARRDKALRSRGGAGSTVATAEVSESATSADLRRALNGAVAREAARTGQSHGALHAAARRAVPGPPSRSASVEVLSKRLDWVEGR